MVRRPPDSPFAGSRKTNPSSTAKNKRAQRVHSRTQGHASDFERTVAAGYAPPHLPFTAADFPIVNRASMPSRRG